MIDLVIDNGGKLERIENLTLKELGNKLVELGKRYFLMFETVRNVDPAIGFTLYIAVAERDR